MIRITIRVALLALSAIACWAQAPPVRVQAGVLDQSTETVGDTLTVIQHPLLNIPAFVTPGGSFTISCEAPSGTTAWAAELIHGALHVPLAVTDSFYDSSTLWWRLSVSAPADAMSELYDLRVTANGGINDITRHAVKVLPSYRDDYYFVQITDTHLPTHLYYYQQGASSDTSEILDLRAVIDDINLINPEFVLLTGDLVNEGELEDFELHRYYTKAQRVLAESQVPVFLTAGNHDLGGWDDTPPSDGTARRDWWRFFGWKRLANPPAGAPARTQDYSFDYGSEHYVALEAYINYDAWLPQYYGSQSFTSAQLQWLNADLAAAGGTSQVLFYHRDFNSQLNLSTLGVEMALSGHIHSDSGSLTSRPYNLATSPTVDGNRSYRVVRVSHGTVTPLATVSAGSSGQALQILYTPANDGTHEAMAAAVTNNLPIRFENALVRFLLPKNGGDVQVSGGTLLQTDSSGAVRVCYVGVDLAANSTQIVSVTTDSSAGVPDPTAAPRLEQNLPNPFAPRTVIAFDLPSPGPVQLWVFGPDGRRVATLIDEELPRGPRLLVWDGKDDEGRPVPSGTYFYRLVTPNGAETRRLTVVR
jgi:hypothetical protein